MLGAIATQDLFIESQELFTESQELLMESQELFTALYWYWCYSFPNSWTYLKKKNKTHSEAKAVTKPSVYNNSTLVGFGQVLQGNPTFGGLLLSMLPIKTTRNNG